MELYLIAAVILVTAGAVGAYVTLVSLGIRRDEKARTMTLRTPDRIARGARAATGMRARYPAVIHEAAFYRQAPPRRPDYDQDLG
jgi:hypothetical protein